MWEVLFYKTESGQIPVKEFLDTLPNNLKSKAIRDIQVLANKGNKIREPYSKNIGNGIFELRTIQSGNTTRIFYFFFVEKKIVLTNGLLKKSQKTPKNVIEMAEKYRDDYLRRKENE